jgi:hypothetical protein
MHKEALAVFLITKAAAAAIGATPSAGDPAAAPGKVRPPADELEEIVVSARRSNEPRENPQVYFNWLARLVGQFTVAGYVDVTSPDATRDVLTAEGTANCIGFGVAPGVQCDLRIRWPEKAAADGKEIPGLGPSLDPAMMLFGFQEKNAYDFEMGGRDLSEYGIKHALIDSRGMFESGYAVHDGEDSVVSKSHCATVRAECERMVRITAAADLREIDMQVEVTIEQRKAVRYVFVMSRVPGSEAQVFGRKTGQERRK